MVFTRWFQTEALEISYSAETGQFSLRLLDMGGSIDESTQSRDGHLDSIEAELEKAVNARWREGGNVLEVFHVGPLHHLRHLAER